MEHRHSLLAYLRARSSRTKHTIAFIGALLPALLVGYAQFYMRAKTENTEHTARASLGTSAVTEESQVSAFAAFTKIFSEGKAAVGDATSALKKFNKAYLSEEVPPQETGRVLTPSQVDEIMIQE